MDYPIDNVGLLVGSASAILLISLEWAATTRETNLWIIWLLPIGGLISGLLYHYLGQRLEKGNNLIIEETSKPYKNIEKDIEALSISILKEDESTITSDFTKKDAYLNEAMHVIKEIN